MSPTLRNSLTALLLAVSAFLAYRLWDGIDSVVESRELIAVQETQMIDRLRLIREAEIVFQEQNGRYTANWDSLADFIENGKVPIIQRREEIKLKAYGGEDVILHIDTLGYIPAKDRIFKKNYTMNAPEDGIFQGFNSKVTVGAKVFKGMDAFEMTSADTARKAANRLAPKFIENGTIAKLFDAPIGTKVTKGTPLISFWEYQFDINTDIRKIGEIPYLTEADGKPVMIQIFAGKVNKSGLLVDVIEVVDPRPANPERKESNEIKTRKPLRFGSRLDASTVGNWE